MSFCLFLYILLFKYQFILPGHYGFFFFQKEVEIAFHKKILSEEFSSSYVRMGLSSLVNSSILKKKNSILHYSFWFFTVLVLSKTFPLLVC